MSRIGSPRTWSAVARQSRLAVPAAATAGALALFAVWTLASSHWSGAPSRAPIPFD
jgi:hypothetical protein